MLKYQNQCPDIPDRKKHPISCVCPTQKQDRGTSSKAEFKPEYVTASTNDPNALMRQFYEV